MPSKEIQPVGEGPEGRTIRTKQRRLRSLQKLAVPEPAFRSEIHCCRLADIFSTHADTTVPTGMHFWHAARRHQSCFVFLNRCSRRKFATFKDRRAWNSNSFKRDGRCMVMDSSEPSCSYSTYCVQQLFTQRLRELFGSHRKCFALAANPYKTTGVIEELPKSVFRENTPSLFHAWRAWHQKSFGNLRITKLLYTDCHWKSIILLRFADNKGQVYLSDGLPVLQSSSDE